MIRIKNENVKKNNTVFDYELENGELLHISEWNGETYGKYKPIYYFEWFNISLDEIEENTEEWETLTKVIGFEKI